MSDEAKRWTIQRTHAFMTRNEVWGPLVEAGEEVEVVPATELDRQVEQHKETWREIDDAQLRAEAAEARVRELEGHIEDFQEARYLEATGNKGVEQKEFERLVAALNAPAECVCGEPTTKDVIHRADAPCYYAPAAADEERHKDG